MHDHPVGLRTIVHGDFCGSTNFGLVIWKASRRGPCTRCRFGGCPCEFCRDLFDDALVVCIRRLSDLRAYTMEAERGSSSAWVETQFDFTGNIFVRPGTIRSISVLGIFFILSRSSSSSSSSGDCNLVATSPRVRRPLCDEVRFRWKLVNGASDCAWFSTFLFPPDLRGLRPPIKYGWFSGRQMWQNYRRLAVPRQHVPRIT